MNANKTLAAISTSIYATLLGIIAFFAQATYSTIETVSSQITGHFIAHGKSDTKFEVVEQAVADMAWNQYLLCKYGEQTWPTHDRCKRSVK